MFWDNLISVRKGKVVPVIFLTEHHAMKAYWEVEVQSTHS
jgi:hypothetical protein